MFNPVVMNMQFINMYLYINPFKFISMFSVVIIFLKTNIF